MSFFHFNCFPQLFTILHDISQTTNVHPIHLILTVKKINVNTNIFSWLYLEFLRLQYAKSVGCNWKKNVGCFRGLDISNLAKDLTQLFPSPMTAFFPVKLYITFVTVALTLCVRLPDPINPSILVLPKGTVSIFSPILFLPRIEETCLFIKIITN